MIYVSVSTIPQRIKTIHKSIESLLNQTLKPDKIFINIPKEFKRFKEKINDNDIPKFPPGVEVTRCEDSGPGTKLLGSLNKIDNNSLLILADDDQIYENFMIEKFNNFYISSPNNSYSFYVHPLGKFGIGQGADGFAINTKFLNGVQSFYDQVVKNYEELFLYDDLWISYYLYFFRKNKILSLQEYLELDKGGKRKTIYKSHTSSHGLISTYGKDINEAIKERDRKAKISFKYMMEKTKNLNF